MTESECHHHSTYFGVATVDGNPCPDGKHAYVWVCQDCERTGFTHEMPAPRWAHVWPQDAEHEPHLACTCLPEMQTHTCAGAELTVVVHTGAAELSGDAVVVAYVNS